MEYINCQNNNLTSLPELPPLLEEIWCDHNKLTSLPEVLPEMLTHLYCGSNELTSLPEFSKRLKIIDCRNNKIEKLPLSFAKIRKINCRGNKLTSLPKKYYPKISYLKHFLKEVESNKIELDAENKKRVTEIPDNLIQEVNLKQNILSFL